MPTFLERYVAGDYEQVWDELLALGSAVREERYYADAVAVARETMHRVRHNCEVLIPRLESLGWKFGYDWTEGREWTKKFIREEPPRLGTPIPSSQLDAIEAMIGILPISLRAFYEVVGAINFVGIFDRPDWDIVEYGLDPFYVVDIAGAIRSARVSPLETHPERIVLRIAGDFYRKFFRSGCDDDFIEIPCSDADATLINGTEFVRLNDYDCDITFIRYLRITLNGGGFQPYFTHYDLADIPYLDIAFLTKDLLPI